MNNIETKTTKDLYVAVNKRTIDLLQKINCIKVWSLYFYLASKQSFKNGLVGVFEEITTYDLARFLLSNHNNEISTTKTKRVLDKLIKANLIKILNQRPLIISLSTAEQAEQFKSLDEVLDYVQANEQEFNFHIQHRRANDFYQTFSRERQAIKTAVQPSNTHQTAKALDELIRARPGRSKPTRQDFEEAMEWASQITKEEEEDPFLEHIQQNTRFIKKEKHNEALTQTNESR